MAATASPTSSRSRASGAARYGTLGGTTETLPDLISRRVLASLEPTDGILGLGMF
jgi:hypothetical protein